MSFGVFPEQSRPYDVRTTQPFTCIYSKEINENIGCSQILFIYIHALTRYQHRSTRTCRGERTTLSSALSRGNPEGDRSRTVAGTRRPASSASFMTMARLTTAALAFDNPAIQPCSSTSPRYDDYEKEYWIKVTAVIRTFLIVNLKSSPTPSRSPAPCLASPRGGPRSARPRPNPRRGQRPRTADDCAPRGASTATQRLPVSPGGHARDEASGGLMPRNRGRACGLAVVGRSG